MPPESTTSQVRIRIAREGDDVPKIAEEEGFFWETVWRHPENAELRRLRRDPNVLLPGDRVAIPPRRRREEERASGQRHRYRLRGVPGRVRIRVLEDGRPRADAPYRLVIDGVPHRGRTDADGFLEHDLPLGAQSGELIFDRDDGGTDHYHFRFGTLDPIDTESGVRKRLVDLGYDAEEDLPGAIRAFQSDHGLEPSGRLDDATRARVQEVFGQ